jgi:MSHA biogenesis protein MshN
MSLINQMLQDLEKRGASSAERGALPNQVRALPRTEKSNMPWWPLGIAAALVVIAALAWQFGNQLTPASPPPLARGAPPTPRPKEVSPAAEMPPARAPTSIETAPSGPASRLALELETAPSADNRPAAAPAEPPAAAEKQLAAQPKLSKALEKSPKTPSAAASSASAKQSPNLPLTSNKVIATEPAISATPVAATPPAEPPKPPPAAPPVASKPATSAAKAVENGAEAKARAALANPQIDKRSHQLTSQQLAENEYRNAANLHNQDRLAEAQEGFRLALQDDPGHTAARQGLFGLLLEAKKNGEAEQVLRDGLDLNLSQPGFAMALARLQVDRGDTVSAIETMQRSASAALGSPDYLAFHAALLQRQSRHQEAVDHYLAALRLAPGSGVWLMGLGISLHALNRNREAQDAFRRAKATNTLNPELQAFVEQRLRQLQ